MYINKHTLNFNFNASNKENRFFEFYNLNKFVFDFVEKIVNEFEKKSHKLFVVNKNICRKQKRLRAQQRYNKNLKFK